MEKLFDMWRMNLNQGYNLLENNEYILYNCDVQKNMEKIITTDCADIIWLKISERSSRTLVKYKIRF